MKLNYMFALVFLSTLVGAGASAWDGVDIVESSGSVSMLVNITASPIPGYCSWASVESDGVVFSVTNMDGAGNSGCTAQWSVGCDSDSLGFTGQWPAIAKEIAYGARYEVSVACTVNVSAETRLSARRSVVGELNTDEHNLTVGFPDGSTVELLSSGSGGDQAQVTLQPGVYHVVLQVLALQSNYPGGGVEPYEGFVLLTWSDPAIVGVEQETWGGTKALYR